MAISNIIKWNLLSLLFVFLAACSGSESDISSTSRDIETSIDHHIVEGDEGSSVLTLYFTSPVNGLINYNTFNITAAEESDFEPIQGTLQAQKGEEYSFDILVYGDTRVEGTESFGLRFSDDQGNEIDSIFGYIENDDFPNVEVNSPQITEGDTGTSKLSFTFSISEEVVDSYSISVVSVSVDDLSDTKKEEFPFLATPDIDYEAVDQVITFKKGELIKTLVLPVYSENIIEEDEVVLLRVTDSYGKSVLSNEYAQGEIRSDETKDINSFNVSYSGALDLKNIIEGTPEDDGPDIWTKVTFPFFVGDEENIIENQNLVFQILSYEEALEKKYITGDEDQAESGESADYKDYYVNTSDKHDICFNSGELVDTEGCQLSNQYVLTPGQTSLEVEFYVRGDKNRELNEDYVISIDNDQGVNFTNVSGTLVNDDSERLDIKIDGKYFDLINFTSDENNKYEVNEPKESEDISIELQLTSILETEYELEYEIVPYEEDGVGADANTDYSPSDTNGKLTFLKNQEGSQTKNIKLSLLGDDVYDGNKDLKVNFIGSDIDPLIIRIKDRDFPEVNLYATENSSGSEITKYFLNEPDEVDVDDIDDFREYSFYLKMSGSSPALSDLEYNVSITTEARNDDLSDGVCLSKDRSGKVADAEYDNDYEVGHGTSYQKFSSTGDNELVIKEGERQVRLAIRVKDDREIECKEEFTVSITPKTPSSSELEEDESVSVSFFIEDDDKANITVKGWSTSEDDIEKNFTVISDRDVIADITASLLSDSEEECKSGLDIESFSTSDISLEPSSLDANVTLKVIEDSIIEPNETCKLFITGYDEDLIRVDYYNADDELLTFDDGIQPHAKGEIINDDQLKISIDVESKEEPAESTDIESSIGKLYWTGNSIASNTGNIIIKFNHAACNDEDLGSDEDLDCVEYSDEESDLNLPEDGLKLNDVIFSDANQQYEIELPITIKADNIVENKEYYKLNVSVDSGGEFISSIPNAISSSISNEDKLNIEFSERTLSPLNSAAIDGEEDGSRYYEITWDKSVASTVGELSVDLSDSDELSVNLYGNATRKVALNQKSFDYTLKVKNEEDYSNNIVIKPEGSKLAANESIELELMLNDDELVEIEELVVMNVSSRDDLLSYINNYSQTLTHKINIDDKLIITIGSPTTDVDYIDDYFEQDENDLKSFIQTIYWDKSVADDVPSIAIDLSIEGSVESEGEDKDYLIEYPNDYSNSTLLIKGENAVPSSRKVDFKFTINNDSIVENDESILTILSKNSTESDSDYKLGDTFYEIHNSNGEAVDILTITHTLKNDDIGTLEFSADATSSEIDTDTASSGIEEGGTITYTLKSDLAIAGDLPALELNILLGGDVDGDDFSVSSDDGQITKKTDSVNTYTYTFIFNPADTALSKDGARTFKLTINNDELIELDETIEASISLPDGMKQYLKLGSETSLTSTIKNDDIGTLEFSGSIVSSGVEKDETITYTLISNKEISGDIPALEFNMPFKGTATLGKDFIFSSGDGQITKKEDSDNTYIFNSEKNQLPENEPRTFQLTINNDDVIEQDETITTTIELSGEAANYLTLGDKSSLSRTIKNDDIGTLEFSGSIVSSGVEKDETITYTLISSKEIAGDLPALELNISFGGTATLGSDNDFSFSSDDGQITKKTDSDNTYTYIFNPEKNQLPANEPRTFQLTINNDVLIERDETITSTIELSGESLNYLALGTKTSLSRIIENDDFINIWLSDSSDFNENSDDEVMSKVFWSGGNTEGIPESIDLGVKITEDGITSDDYSVSDIKITNNYGEITKNTEGFDFIQIKDDLIIEENESMSVTFNLTADQKEFIKVKSEDAYTYTIIDDDDLILSIESSLEGSNTEHLIEGGALNLKACAPTGYSVPSGANNFEMLFEVSYPSESASNIFKPADNTIFTTNEFDIELGLSSGLSSGACIESTIFTVDDIGSQNVFFNLTSKTSDQRCEGSACIDEEVRIILNDDYNPITDTGLVECVESGINKRWDVPCSGDNDHVPDQYYQQNYQYQDGAETDFYPSLAYTYINEEGEPVMQMPTDQNAQVCFQDNNTGLIFSSSSDAANFSDLNSLSFDTCSLSDETKTWKIPSVQELITIMDLNPLSTNKPLNENVLNLKQSGDIFYSSHSRYWTADECNVSGVENGRWVIDFISGHINCSDINDGSNYFIKVYK